jgi:maleate cis-trans isomerase
MYGALGRVGYLAPATCETTTIEYYEMLPPGVSLTVSTLHVNRISRSELDQESKNLERAALDFRDQVDVIGMGGAPMAYMLGLGSEVRLAKAVSDVAGVPAFYDISAVHDGLRALGAGRVAIASPFDEEVNDPMRRFFEDAGFVVSSLIGGHYKTNAELRRVPPDVPYRFGRAALLAAPQAEALFINCSGWATYPAIAELEKDFNVPVITQISALVWRSLHILGIPQRAKTFCKLLRLPSAAAA